MADESPPLHVGTEEECDDFGGEWDDDNHVCWDKLGEKGGLTAPIHGVRIGFGFTEFGPMDVGSEQFDRVLDVAGIPEDTEYLFEPDVGILKVTEDGSEFGSHVDAEWRASEQYNATPEEAAGEAEHIAEQLIEEVREAPTGRKVSRDMEIHEVGNHRIAAEDPADARRRVSKLTGRGPRRGVQSGFDEMTVDR